MLYLAMNAAAFVHSPALSSFAMAETVDVDAMYATEIVDGMEISGRAAMQRRDCGWDGRGDGVQPERL